MRKCILTLVLLSSCAISTFAQKNYFRVDVFLGGSRTEIGESIDKLLKAELTELGDVQTVNDGDITLWVSIKKKNNNYFFNVVATEKIECTNEHFLYISDYDTENLSMSEVRLAVKTIVMDFDKGALREKRKKKNKD